MSREGLQQVLSGGQGRVGSEEVLANEDGRRKRGSGHVLLDFYIPAGLGTMSRLVCGMIAYLT